MPAAGSAGSGTGAGVLSVCVDCVAAADMLQVASQAPV